MSGVQGKNGRNIDKLLVKESSVPSVGFKNVRFLHEAAADDTVIDITSLTVPADATTNGFVQPSASDLQKVSLRQFKDNFTLRTGTGQLIQDIDYVISGATTIKLTVPALEGQVFEGVMNAEPRVGTTLLDAQPLAVAGVLAANTTDFNVGQSFKVGDNINNQIGAVAVFIDNELAYRNVGNQPDGEGDYYEVHAGAGLGTIIRMNNTDSEDRGVVVMSIGALVERPDGSQDALIESLGGQIDIIREILEEVTGETIAPGAPNNIDLKAFGDRVLQLEQDIQTKEDKFTIPVQTKILSANINADGAVSDLQFNNLTIGKLYRISGTVNFTRTAGGSDNIDLQFANDVAGVNRYGLATENIDAVGQVRRQHVNIIFTASSDTLYCVAASVADVFSIIQGTNSRDGTFITLEELDKHEVTTKFN